MIDAVGVNRRAPRRERALVSRDPFFMPFAVSFEAIAVHFKNLRTSRNVSIDLHTMRVSIQTCCLEI